MSALTDRGKAAFLRAAKREGIKLTFTHSDGSSFDPDTGTVTDNTTSVDLWCIRSNLTPQDDARFAPETLTENRAAKLITEFYELSVGDEVQYKSANWAVKGFSPVEPGDAGVIQKVLIERVG